MGFERAAQSRCFVMDFFARTYLHRALVLRSVSCGYFNMCMLHVWRMTYSQAILTDQCRSYATNLCSDTGHGI